MIADTQFFVMLLGDFFKTAKSPPIWLSMAYMTTYKPCPFTALRAVSWTAGAV